VSAIRTSIVKARGHFVNGLLEFKSRASVSFHAAAQRPPHSYPTLHYRYAHDIGNVLILRFVGLQASNGVVTWRKRRALLAVSVMLSPLFLAVILSVPTDVNGVLVFPYYLWFVYFASLCSVVIMFAWAGVTVFHRLTPDLEEILTDDGRVAYDRWANITTAILPQSVFGVVFSSFALVALRLAARAPGMNSRLYVGPASYFSVGLSGLIIAGGAYWILAGTILSAVLGRSRHMKLWWQAPGHTVGLDLLARCYRLTFYGASIGVALCLIPILSWAYGGPNSVLLSAVKTGLFIASATVVLAVAVIPQWQLSSVVAAARRSTLKELQRQLPLSSALAIQSSSSTSDSVAALIELVAGSPSTTIKESTVAGVLLGLATALLPYMIKFVS
jgi:hypothetical protein